MTHCGHALPRVRLAKTTPSAKLQEFIISRITSKLGESRTCTNRAPKAAVVIETVRFRDESRKAKILNWQAVRDASLLTNDAHDQHRRK